MRRTERKVSDMSSSNGELITSLIFLTQQEKIRWRISDHPADVFDDIEISGYIYEGIFNNKKVLLFRFTYLFGDDEDLRRSFSYRLILSDLDGVSEMEIDNKYLLQTLYDIVRNECHGVTDWIQEVIDSARKSN